MSAALVLLNVYDDPSYRARRANWRRYIRRGLALSNEPALVEVWPSGHVCEWRPLAADLVADDWVEVGGVG